MATATQQETIDFGPAERILNELSAVHSGHLIPLLQKIQEAYGYLPKPVLQEVSRRTSIPVSRMYGVITFYAQFYLQPHGRHTIRCCRGTACHVKGSLAIAEAIEHELGVRDGQTTPTRRFTFETVACLGTCFLAPVVMVDDDYYGLMTPERVPGILEKYQ